jgi:hypothetical protein
MGHYATNRKVDGTIPDGVIGVFSRTMAPGVDSAF